MRMAVVGRLALLWGVAAACGVPTELVVPSDRIVVLGSESRIFAFGEAADFNFVAVIWARHVASDGVVATDRSLEGAKLAEVLLPSDDYCERVEFERLDWSPEFQVTVRSDAEPTSACAFPRSSAPCSVQCGRTKWTILSGD